MQQNNVQFLPETATYYKWLTTGQETFTFGYAYSNPGASNVLLVSHCLSDHQSTRIDSVMSKSKVHRISTVHRKRSWRGGRGERKVAKECEGGRVDKAVEREKKWVWENRSGEKGRGGQLASRRSGHHISFTVVRCCIILGWAWVSSW